MHGSLIFHYMSLGRCAQANFAPGLWAPVTTMYILLRSLSTRISVAMFFAVVRLPVPRCCYIIVLVYQVIRTVGDLLCSSP